MQNSYENSEVPDGRMHLKFEHEEESNGHRDNYWRWSLVAEGGSVVLIEWTKTTSAYKMSDPGHERTDRFAITPEKLVELIKANGVAM